MARQSYRRPFADGTREMISIDSTLNNQLSTINCFNEERHMSERVFYPDTNFGSSARQTRQRHRAIERVKSFLPIQRFTRRQPDDKSDLESLDKKLDRDVVCRSDLF